jgi:hypothetical protein
MDISPLKNTLSLSLHSKILKCFQFVIFIGAINISIANQLKPLKNNGFCKASDRNLKLHVSCIICNTCCWSGMTAMFPTLENQF